MGPISEYTNVATNGNGTVVQTLDYYPYGATRISSGQNASSRKYIGQFSDVSGLLYLQARYDDPQRGQFLSEDPVFWEIGLTKDGMKALANPQYANSYAYSLDNPITTKDPSGRVGWDTAADIAVEYGGPLDAQLGSMMSSALSWVGSIASGIGSAILYNSSDISLRISNGIKYGGELDPRRIVRPSSNLPDPTGNPWPGWQPRDPKDWKTWLEAAPNIGTVGGLGWGAYKTVVNYMTSPSQGSGNPGGWNSQAYAQSVSYSQATGKPSNNVSLASSGSGGGGGYASQTYQVPSGAIVDWNGNVIVAPPSSKKN